MMQATAPSFLPASARPRFALFTLLAALGCGWSIQWGAGPSGLSMLWIPGGLLLGFLLTSPRRHWRGHLACALLALVTVKLLLGKGGVLSLAFTLCSLLEAWLAAQIVAPRVADFGQLATIKRTLRTSSLATLFASTLSALLAAGVLQAQSPQLGFAVPFATWLASHALGMGIFGTLTVIARIEGRRMLGPPARRWELAATLLLIAICTLLVFAQSRLPLAFLLLPLLLVCVLRHRFSGFVPAIALVALVATTATAAGHGPFAMGIGAGDDVVRSRLLQLFLLCCCLVAFPVAAVLTERRILARRMQRGRQQYRMLADNSRDLILRIGMGRTLDYISPSVTELLGWTREEFDRMRWELVHPEDRLLLQDAILPLYQENGIASATYRCLHKQGHYVWLAAHLRSAQDENGGRSMVLSARDITSRVEAEQALAQQARRDPLTGLANRLLLDERMALALARAHRNKAHVGLLYCDIDHFKAINDHHGHAAGDHALCEFAQRLNGCIRSVDLAVRLGGDEFVVLVEDIATPQSLQFIANKLVLAMREPILFNDIRLDISTSIGIAMSGPRHPDAESLLKLADAALYQAKAAGRNTWRLADPAAAGDRPSSP